MNIVLQVSDALALAARFGCPTFFVTVTCNPDWPEITNILRPGQFFHDQPLVVARVFKQKLKNIMIAISNMFPNAGRNVLPVLDLTVEFNTFIQARCYIKCT